jgi:hypothetical protein
MAGQHAYKLLDLQKHMVFSSRHVKFNEQGVFSPSELRAWASNSTGEQWEGLVPKRLSKPDNRHTTEEEDEQTLSLERPPVGAVGGNQPPPLAPQERAAEPDLEPDSEPEAVGGERPQTPDQPPPPPEEPRTPPNQRP